MDIETSGAIKLFFPSPSLSLVYFEALANALDAGATEVSIEIDVQAFDKPDTLRIAISDNGDGFTDENFNRFKKLLKPRDKFHKGIGRLVFLNYFKRVDVNSVWDKKQRQFIFKEEFDGNASVEDLQIEQKNRTSLVFTGFANDRVKSYDDLKPDAIKSKVIEQFLPTLDARKRDNKPFNIAIDLKTSESNPQKEFFPHKTTITTDDLPSMTKVVIQDDLLDAFSTISMHYHIKAVSGKGSSLIAFSIDGRTIPAGLIQPSALPTGYLYVFLFESEIFDSNSDSSRQKLMLPDGMHEAQLYRVLRRELGKVLTSQIPQITENNERVKAKFEEQFPHLLGYFEKDTIGLIEKDDALGIAQQRFFRIQKEILQCERLSDATYEKSLEMSARTLMEYVLYREKMIGRMKELTEENSESEIHNLIVPRFTEYSQASIASELYQNNAWLLDDKFMVFQTILSEKSMDAVINAIRLEDEKVGYNGRPILQ